MYPFTPIELHSGVLIGKERILTNRSGHFGWGDASAFRAHVFDSDGKQTDRNQGPPCCQRRQGLRRAAYPRRILGGNR